MISGIGTGFLNAQNPDTNLADEVFAEYGVGPSHRAYHLYDAGIAGGSFGTNLDKLGARGLALESNEWTLSDKRWS